MGKIIFWKDKDKKVVNPELFSSQAMDLSRELEEQGRKRNENGNFATDKDGKYVYDKNKRNQIRKFYDEVQRLNDVARQDPSRWENVEPLLHMIVAKGAYAEGRRLTSEGFTEFIRQAVTMVKTPDDLKIFANFFEAFMGFYRLYGPTN